MNTKSVVSLRVAFASTVAAVIAAPSVAFAALPLGATTAFSTVQTDALELIDLAWPVVIAVTSGFILVKLFKKAASKVG
jgi:hypothetical protein